MGVGVTLLSVIPRFLWLLAVLTLPPQADASVWHVLNPPLRTLDERIAAQQRRLHELPPMPALSPQEALGFHSGFAKSADSLRWVQVDLGAEYPLDAVVIVPAMLGASEAYGFPLRFRIDASRDGQFGDSVTLFDHTAKDAMTPLAPWYLPAKGVRVRYVRFTATRLTTQARLNGRYIFCLGELMAFSGGRNVALSAKVYAPNAPETLPTWSPHWLVDGASVLGLPIRPDNVAGNGWHGAIESKPDRTQWVQADLGGSQEIEEIRIIPAHPRDYPDRAGFGFPRRFKVEISDAVDFVAPHIALDATGEDFINPGDHAVAFPVVGLTGRYVRVTATRLWERSGDFVYALAELQVLVGGRNAALYGVVTSSGDTTTSSWSREQLVDDRGSSGVLLSEAPWLAQLSERRELELDRVALLAQREAALTVAHSRAAWMGGALTGGGLLWAWLGWRCARRNRQAELEALRQRISRDLHDEIGSHLGSIRLTSEMALRDSDFDGAQPALEEIHRLAREAAESMRGIIWLVREGGAPTLDRLTEALRQTAGALLKGIEWTFKVDAGEPARTASLEFHRQVLLFFRETVHNIVRHAGAKHVNVGISWRDGRFHLEVRDDGCGFQSEDARFGSGLANLGHRAALLQGSAVITSAPNQGTIIKLEASLS